MPVPQTETELLSENSSEIKLSEQTVEDVEISSQENNINKEPSTLFNFIQKPEFKFIGEAFNTYIIIEKDKELILIDKHALHERMIYEQLKKDAVVSSRMLLVPHTVTLDKSVYTSAVENLDMFKDCGFDVEDFGLPTLVVRSAPQYIEDCDVEDTIIEMADHIAKNKRDIRTEKMDWIYHNIACRAAVKAGNRSTEQELKALAEEMLSDESLRYCPHGRPVCFVLKKSEIEKQFGRV